MTTTAFIPDDIWIHAAQFLSEDDLKGFISLNRVFFDLGMNARYQVVLITYENKSSLQPTYPTQRLLSRLRDEAVAKYVRSLRIHFVRVHQPPLKFIRALLQAVVYLKYVEELSIAWQDPRHSGLDLLPLTSLCWATFGSNLKALTLWMGAEDIIAAVSNSTCLDKIRDLDISVTVTYFRAREMDHMTLQNVTAPFINRFGPSLERLTISSPHYLDLSLLFPALGSFPNLRHLRIPVVLNRCGLSDSSGVTRLLSDHSDNLTEVELGLNPGTWSAGVHGDEEEALKSWMRKNTSNERVLANLRSLATKIPIEDDDLFLSMPYIKRSASTLVELTLSGRYLSFSEVRTLLDPFLNRPTASGLRALALKVHTLTPELLELLARMAPDLEELKLRLLRFGRIESPVINTNSLKQDIPAIRIEFLNRDALYTRWRLGDFSVFAGNNERPHAIERAVAEVILECVPSIRTVWGHELSFLERPSNSLQMSNAVTRPYGF